MLSFVGCRDAGVFYGVLSLFSEKRPVVPDKNPFIRGLSVSRLACGAVALPLQLRSSATHENTLSSIRLRNTFGERALQQLAALRREVRLEGLQSTRVRDIGLGSGLGLGLGRSASKAC